MKPTFQIKFLLIVLNCIGIAVGVPTVTNGNYASNQVFYKGSLKTDQEILNAPVENNNDWSGFYMAENVNTAAKYILETSTGRETRWTAYLYKLSPTKTLSYYICQDGGSSCNNSNLSTIKSRLGISEEELFIPTLGNKAHLFVTLETDGTNDYEIILPNDMRDQLKVVGYATYSCSQPGGRSECTFKFGSGNYDGLDLGTVKQDS